MKHPLDLKINPPLQMLISVLLIYITAQLLPVSTALLAYKWPLSSAFLVLGLFFNMAGGTSFRTAKTTGNPNRPHMASKLVTSGVYQFTRNPMYIGLIFLLLTWAVWLGSVFSLLIIVLFQQYITRFQIIPEESALQKRFPEQFTQYCQQVRRWL